MDLAVFKSNGSLAFILTHSSLLQWFNPYITGDGNCEFRALAKSIKNDQEQWKLIKLAMCNRLRTHLDLYQRALSYDTAALLKIFECQDSPCSPEHWFIVPDCAQIAADTFNTPIAVYSGTGSNPQTFLPLGMP